jgi:DNA helicase-4
MSLFEKILDIIFPNRYKKYYIIINENKENIKKAYLELKEPYDKEEYFTKKSYNLWKDKWNNLSELLRNYQKIKRKLPSPLDKELDFLYSAFNESSFLKTRNSQYVQTEITKNQNYFNTLEKYPLTQEQCQAIVVDEASNLVIAGAGTGKTSTLIGKAGYILRRGFAKPNEILLLSYGRDPRDEMLERVQKRFSLPLEVSTFHSLGMKIIAEAQNLKPRVSKLSTDQAMLQKYIDDVINEKKKDIVFLKSLNNFFLRLTSYKTQWDFKTQNEYIEYIKSQHLRSLKGDNVKSHQELEIANYLYMNGVEYEYERPYEHRTKSKLYSQYRPDFYLTHYKIYLEHFGIDQNGNTASYVNKEKYNEEIRRKRALHKAHGTKLIETYSYEARGGGLQAALKRKLKEKGVELNPIPEEKIFDKLNELGLVTPISGLIASFLNLYKSNNMQLDDLKVRSREFESPERAKTFVEIFSEVLDEYENKLASMSELDFNDMINKATEYLDAGEAKLGYKYILVDEFQDISQSRYKLLKAILDQNSDCKLFAVGDDWQSIFRFAGSDLNVMIQFERYFGESEILFIGENFRFNNKICDLSTKFILENPKQIRKQLKPNEFITEPAVSLIYTKNPQAEIEKILSKLSEKGGAIQILGRYNKPKPSIPNNTKPSIEFLTAHRSKGTQADYVIILGLKSGIMGFPCEITDDPILQLVMPEPDTYPHAEERRLFYVALTRAKKHIYLLTDPDKPSAFVTEILKKGYEVELMNEPKNVGGECPRCGGEVEKKNGSNGYFYSCGNYPYCEYKAPRCPDCGGSLLLNDQKLVCDECNKSFRTCPSCGEGVLISRVGPYSRFLGCSNYPECTYTEKV